MSHTPLQQLAPPHQTPLSSTFGPPAPHISRLLQIWRLCLQSIFRVYPQLGRWHNAIAIERVMGAGVGGAERPLELLVPKSWPSVPPTLRRSFSFISFYYICTYVVGIYLYIYVYIYTFAFAAEGIGRPHGWLECVKHCRCVCVCVCVSASSTLYLYLSASICVRLFRPLQLVEMNGAARLSGKAPTAMLGRWRAMFPPSSVIKKYNCI